MAAPRMSLRAEQKAGTRRRLLAAAMDVFAEKGYAATTVDDIVVAAGTSAATFYLHFKRKVDVLVAAVEDEESQVASSAGTLPAPPDGLDADVLKAWVTRVLAGWQDLRVAHQVQNQAALIEPELKAMLTRRFEDGIAYWEEFLHCVGMPRGKARKAEAALLNATFVGLFEMWIVSGINLDRLALTARLADSIWHRVVDLGYGRESSAAAPPLAQVSTNGRTGRAVRAVP